jgi:small subunit ribosomal protein S1
VSDVTDDPVPEAAEGGATVEAPVEMPVEAPVETPVETPAEASVEASVEAPATAPPASAPARPPRARNSALARAYRTGRPIDGQVSRVIKGGYEVQFGSARGFCPHSQIDVHREDQPEQRIGQTYAFRITQIRRGGEDVVVSRRALLEEQRVEEAKAVRATLVEGALILGRVAGLAPFGAFIDRGAGVQGLVHVSELSHQRVHNVEEVLKIGDEVRVRILKLREPAGKISLSLRQAEPDPWDGSEERFAPGTLVSGAVSRMADFGVFVELAPGIEALAPASELPPLDPDWRTRLQPGTHEQWWILASDARARRISVTLPADAVPPLAPLQVGSVLSGRIQRIERYGVFVWLGPGRVGLLPFGARPADRAGPRIGDTIEVKVADLGEDGRRLRLAPPAEEPAPSPAAPRAEAQSKERRPRERNEPRRATEPQTADPAQTFGTSLGDKLREALKRS